MKHSKEEFFSLIYKKKLFLKKIFLGTLTEYKETHFLKYTVKYMD